MILNLVTAIFTKIFIWFANLVGSIRNLLVAIIPINLTSTASLFTGLGGLAICSMYYSLKHHINVSSKENQDNNLKIDGQFFIALFASTVVAGLIVQGVPLVLPFIASFYPSLIWGAIVTIYVLLLIAQHSRLNPPPLEDDSTNSLMLTHQSRTPTAERTMPPPGAPEMKGPGTST